MRVCAARSEKPRPPEKKKGKKQSREDADLAAAIAASRAMASASGVGNGNALASESAGMEEDGVEEGLAPGLAADLLRRSGRDAAPKGDPSDVRLLREAITELKRVWRGREPSGEWSLERDAMGVDGLLVVANCLNAEEVRAIRLLLATAAESLGQRARLPLSSLVL